MRAFCLSGWGQPYDALRAVVPEAAHASYAHHETIDDALNDIARQAHGHGVVVGWSLGGQLAVRAIAAGYMKPEKLVLIGTPFQFVETQQAGLGMKRDLFDKFRENYAKNPSRTLNKAWELVLVDDKYPETIRGYMETHDKQHVLAHDWHRWLVMLDGFSCHALDYSAFPPTLIVHGKKDVVVGHDQAHHFERSIPSSRLVSLQDCGHAPHWHDSEQVARLIAEHVYV